MAPDLISAYILVSYVIVFATCLLGSFNHRYEANILQSIALAILAFWCIWRIKLVWSFGWGFPHEPLLATGLVCHCVGSITKTVFFWKARK